MPVAVSLSNAAPTATPSSVTGPFTMVSEKINNRNKWVDDKHTDYPQSFCFIGNSLINRRINNHPYFKSENQYSNYNNNWQPCT